MGFPEQLYTIDILFAVFVLLFALNGSRYGLASELAHAMTKMALLAGICFFYPQLLSLVSAQKWPLPESVTGFLVPAFMLLASVLLFFTLLVLFEKMFQDKLNGTVDKAGGALAGVLRGALTGLMIFSCLSLIPSKGLYQVLSNRSLVGLWVCDTLTPWAKPRVMKMPVMKATVRQPVDEVTP
jgi:uncharacterized membrane protein required for colicin V production